MRSKSGMCSKIGMRSDNRHRLEIAGNRNFVPQDEILRYGRLENLRYTRILRGFRSSLYQAW
jgi:hypothetical protein